MSDAAAPCQLLPWDSDWFGFRVARVEGDTLTAARAQNIDDWCRQQQVRCLYFLARADDPATTQAAQTAGYLLADIRVTLDRDMRFVVPPSGGTSAADRLKAELQTPGIRLATVKDLPDLKKIAAGSFRDSRFYFDGNFPVERVDALFERWVERALERGTNQQALVATGPEGQLTGFCVLGIEPAKRTGDIGLFGVASAARGQGVGRQLLTATFQHLASTGLPHVTVVTQGRNIAAQRLYQRAGFLTKSVQLYYHKWF